MTEELKNGLGYDLPEQIETEVTIPLKPGEKQVTWDELTPLQKISIGARSHGVEIKQPERNCSRCYGRGYISLKNFSIEGNDKVVAIPNPCTCICRTKSDRVKLFPGEYLKSEKRQKKENNKLERIHSKLEQKVKNKPQLVQELRLKKKKKREMRKKFNSK